MNSYRKAKSVAKDVLVVGPKLENTVLSTMRTISDVVGATLGPSGRPVLIERQEYGLPHIVTKDGVTVFRNLGFNDPTAHVIMEVAREAATRTVSEAGDGTTTATVLAEAIVRHTYNYCKKNPKVSSQKVVRKLETLFRDFVEPKIKKWSMKPTDAMLHSVAKLSANGDAELADAVIKCFDLVGDEGNISIIEQSGPSHYEVQSLKGYPISMGYEESCAKFFQFFQNDKANNRCFMEKPVFILYYGAITEIQTISKLLMFIGDAWAEPERTGLEKPFNHNVVLVATGFSETVLATLANNFVQGNTINVFPLLTPKSPVQNGEMHFMYDLAAVTGATVFDPLSKPIDSASLRDLGYGLESFESTRYRSTILGLCDESLIIMRAEEIRNAIPNAESKMDKAILEERAAKLVGGVAKLIVVGASNGELREKRDRVEDAVCAVRGARKHGCLPGGGWTLKQLISELDTYADDEIIDNVLIPALKEPIIRIFRNCGMDEEEIQSTMDLIGNRYVAEPGELWGQGDNVAVVYDAWEGKQVDAVAGGILDSTPAVLEAIRNSISIASLLGTTGGTIAFKRDDELERQEAMDTNHFMKSFNGE